MRTCSETVYPAAGFSSESFLYEVAESITSMDKPAYIYHFGDQPVSQLVFNPFESPYRPATVARASMQEEVPAVETDSVPTDGVAYDFKDRVQNFEISLLKQALAQNQFNQKKAAEYLGLSYHQLRGYLRKYELIGGDE